MDPLGHTLLARRFALIPEIISQMVSQPVRPQFAQRLPLDRCIITGTGSSEAHARYLAYLLNFHTSTAAAYLPLSGFSDLHRETFKDKTLILFSQGLSPNAQLALRYAPEFAHTILFTSTTPEIARSAGKPERAAQLDTFMANGGELIVFPLAEEYTTLIRVVGPIAGYLACLQFVSALPHSRITAPGMTELSPLLSLKAPGALIEEIKSNPSRYAQGLHLLAASPTSEYAQNLACKFMEGLFWPCPSISDFLQFAHGPFQQVTARPHPVIILQSNFPAEAELATRAATMLTEAGQPPYSIYISASPQLAIFGYETIFNDLVLKLIAHFGIDQINWPGRGRDDLLYGFCPDIARQPQSGT